MKAILSKLFGRKSTDAAIPLGSSDTSSFTPNKKRRRNPMGLVVALVLVVGGVFGGQYLLGRNKPAVQGAVTSPVSSRSKVASIDKAFSFVAYNKDKKLVDANKLAYVLTTAEKTDQIVIKGKRATAVPGRSFLIINLKLTNEQDEPLFMNTRNYIRVQPAGTEDKLAPEIHNDTVEIQADSTKVTRIGMPIDSNQNEFTIYVGDPEGKDRQEVQIKF